MQIKRDLKPFKSQSQNVAHVSVIQTFSLRHLIHLVRRCAFWVSTINWIKSLKNPSKKEHVNRYFHAKSGKCRLFVINLK